MKAEVKEVIYDSIAYEIGIEPGDKICSVNEETFNDILEFSFLTASEEFSIEVEKKDGEIEIIQIINEDFEDLGIVFTKPLIDTARSCSNKCIFCFIDQLPKGLRKPLYFKDDDTRLSFLQGNYVTLTNMQDSEIERMIRYRISPVNISVHTTNSQLRVEMLGNKNAGNIMDTIQRFADADMIMNCQIVLCKGINDGYELDKSLDDLTKLYPNVNSISVVPAGLTKYRDKLYQLEGFTQNDCIEVINRVEKWQESLQEEKGSKIVFIADEFYVAAKRPIPEYIEYEDFPQIENGVGLLASLKFEFYSYLKELEGKIDTDIKREISIATGEASYDTICELADHIETVYNNVKIKVYKVINNFFGSNVTVTGLLTGRDIIDQLKGKFLGSELFLSASVLRSERDYLLDDTTIKDIENRLNVNVVLVENSGFDFINNLFNIN